MSSANDTLSSLSIGILEPYESVFKVVLILVLVLVLLMPSIGSFSANTSLELVHI